MFQKLTYGLLFLFIITTITCHKKNPTSPPAEEIPATMPQTDIPWPSLADSPWPMAHHDPQLTGRSPFQGPQIGELEWKANLFEYETSSGISLGVDGTIYYTCYKHLVALNPDGTEKWRFECGLNPAPTPLIGADNTIYLPSSDGNFYAIHPDGTLKWKCHIGEMLSNSSTIGLDGTLYVVASLSSLYAISPGGDVRWNIMPEKGFLCYCPAFSPDGTTLYLSGYDDPYLYAISTAGKIKWQYLIPDAFDMGPLIDNYGVIYIKSNGRIITLTPAGQVRWEYQYAKYGSRVGFMTMDKNGCLYFEDDTNRRIVSLDYAGNFRWEWKFPTVMSVTSALVCDSQARIYFPSDNNQYGLVALTHDGKLIWQARFNFSPIGFPEFSPAIGSNQRLYRNAAGTTGRWIYSIK